MPALRRAARVAPLVLGLCAACGAAPTGGTCTAYPLPSASPPSASAGALAAGADRGRVDRGGHVDLTVTVTGPARYAAACTGPLTLIVSDPSGMHVYSQAPPAERGTPCGDVSLPAGAHATYTIRWEPDVTLPSLRYVATLVLGDQAPLTLGVMVGDASDFARRVCT